MQEKFPLRDKLNYSAFDRDLRPSRTHAMHVQHVSEVQAAKILSCAKLFYSTM